MVDGVSSAFFPLVSPSSFRHHKRLRHRRAERQELQRRGALLGRCGEPTAGLGGKTGNAVLNVKALGGAAAAVVVAMIASLVAVV